MRRSYQPGCGASLADALVAMSAESAGAVLVTFNKRHYPMIDDWSDEDEAYVAEAPELPGCAADGETYAQALANAEVVIREWIATARELGRPIPEPKGRLLYA